MPLLKVLESALLAYLFFIPLLTFHEWAHAWTAWKCGDDTAYQRGRVSLNPVVHMELIGTVVLPLLGILSGAMGWGVFFIGWGKPVPVNPYNLKHPRLQDCLIAMAGPAINLVLAFFLVLIGKILVLKGHYDAAETLLFAAKLSMCLCLFNLIPIPPLDGSHLILNLTRMSYEAYYRFAQFGFIVILVMFQFKPVQKAVMKVIDGSMLLLFRAVRLDISG